MISGKKLGQGVGLNMRFKTWDLRMRSARIFGFKKAQRHDRKPGRVFCLRAEGFFCLDFFGYFLYQDKK